MSDDDPIIKVFASDDNLKALGELLANDNARKIILNLMTGEMYTNQIATKLDIRVSLVIHHLKKLEELGLLEIDDKKIKRKGQKHRFFKIDDYSAAKSKPTGAPRERCILITISTVQHGGRYSDNE